MTAPMGQGNGADGMTAKASASTGPAAQAGEVAAAALRLKWHEAMPGRAAMLAPAQFFAPDIRRSGPRTVAGRLEQSTSLGPVLPVGQGLPAGTGRGDLAQGKAVGPKPGPAPDQVERPATVQATAPDAAGSDRDERADHRAGARSAASAGAARPATGRAEAGCVDPRPPDSRNGTRRAAPLRIAEASAEAGLVPPAASAAAGPVRAGAAATQPLSGRLILIGASTGGVQALERILAVFPANCPPVVIVQHMPADFLASLVQRLDQAIAPRVRLAADGMAVRPGEVLLAPGGRHLRLIADPCLHCALIEGPPRNGHRPSIDETFDSARPFAAQVTAALLTGMGRDGAGAMRALRMAGARTLAQDQASSVVWGMPRAAWTHGGAEMLVPLGRIADCLLMMSGGTGKGRSPPG